MAAALEQQEGMLNAQVNADTQMQEADFLFDKGVDAFNNGDYVKAIELLSTCLATSTKRYGELSVEAMPVYVMYGKALLRKAMQDIYAESSDDDHKMEIEEETSNAAGTKGENSDLMEGDYENEDVMEAEEDDDEYECEGAEEENLDDDSGEDDLELAWYVFDVARCIMEREQFCSIDWIKRAEVYTCIGDVALECEDYEVSVENYANALDLVERFAEAHSKQLAHLYLKMCTAFELGENFKEALVYATKGRNICERRLEACRKEFEAVQNRQDPGKDRNSNELVSEHYETSNLLVNIMAKIDQLHQSMPLSDTVIIQDTDPHCDFEPTMVLANSLVEKCEEPNRSCIFPVKDLGIVGRGTRRLQIT